MEIAIIDLGRMDLNMCKGLLRGNHAVYANDRDADKITEAEAAGCHALRQFEDITKMTAPRTAGVMVPAGPPTEDVIQKLAALLSKGDTIIDGGNSFYKDSIARQASLEKRGIFSSMREPAAASGGSKPATA